MTSTDRPDRTAALAAFDEAARDRITAAAHALADDGPVAALVAARQR